MEAVKSLSKVVRSMMFGSSLADGGVRCQGEVQNAGQKRRDQTRDQNHSYTPQVKTVDKCSWSLWFRSAETI